MRNNLVWINEKSFFDGTIFTVVKVKKQTALEA